MSRVARFDMAQHAGARFTTAEFAHMVASGAFDDMKVELVEGGLERVNFPKSQHSIRQTRLLFALTRAIDGTTLAATAEIGIDLGNDTVRGCDVAILRAVPQEDRWMRPEEMLLVVEVAETTIRRDLGYKRVAYAAAGIPRYWVVDGDRSIVHVYDDPIDGEYAWIRTVKFGEALDVPGTDQTIVIA
jgi:Uma2 family endonuclease